MKRRECNAHIKKNTNDVWKNTCLACLVYPEEQNAYAAISGAQYKEDGERLYVDNGKDKDSTRTINYLILFSWNRLILLYFCVVFFCLLLSCSFLYAAWRVLSQWLNEKKNDEKQPTKREYYIKTREFGCMLTMTLWTLFFWED